jgi:hypothetical protein
MAERPRVRVTGQHYTHRRLWRTAKHLHGLAVAKETRSYYPFLAATVFAFFAFEGFLNEVGRQIADDVWDKERELFSRGEFSGTMGKFLFLADRAELQVQKDRPPYQTVRLLASVRDILVHARTEEVDIELRTDDLNAVGVPAAKVDELGTRAYSSKALEAVEALSNQLMQAVFDKFGDTGVGHEGRAFEGVDGMHQASVE